MGLGDIFGIGIKESIRKTLEKVELPDILNTAFIEGDILNYEKTRMVIKDLRYYKTVAKGLPDYLAEFSRVSQNFCNHVVPKLESYASAMLSIPTADEFDEYTLGLKALLVEIKKMCNNPNILKIKKSTYKDALEKLNVTFGSSSSKLPGDYAWALKHCVDNTCYQVAGASIDDRNDKGIPKLFDILGVSGKSKSKELIKNFVSSGVGERISLAASRVSSGIVSGAKKFMAKLLIKQSLDPVEFYQFTAKSYLDISTVHTISKILNSYLSTLKSYPRGVSTYVSNCRIFINAFLKMLGNYESCFKILKNPKKSAADKIAARKTLYKVLIDMHALLVANTDKNNNAIFVLQEDVVGKSRDPKFDYDRSYWPTGKGAERIKNSDGNYIVIKGWSLGDFLLQALPCFAYTKDNFEVFLKAHKISSEGDAIGYDNSSYLKQITPILDKSAKLNKELVKLHEEIESLSLVPNDIRDDAEEKYNRFRAMYMEIKNFLGKSNVLNKTYFTVDAGADYLHKTFSGKDTANQPIFGDGFFEVGITLIDDKDAVNKLILTSSSAVSKLSNAIEIETKKSLWGAILNYCLDHFKDISDIGNELIETYRGWVKFYSSSKAKAKKTGKNGASASVAETKNQVSPAPSVAPSAPKALDTENDIKAVLEENENNQEKLENLAKEIGFGQARTTPLEAYVKRIDKLEKTKTWDDYKEEYNNCNALIEKANSSAGDLKKIKVPDNDGKKSQKVKLIDKNTVKSVACNLLNLAFNSGIKQKVMGLISAIRGNQNDFDVKFKEIEKWKDDTIKAMNAPSTPLPETKEAKGDAGEAPKAKDNSLKGQLEELLGSYNEMQKKLPNLDAWKKQYGLGILGGTDEKIAKAATKAEAEEAGEKETLWDRCKETYKQCKDCMENAEKSFKKLSKIEIKSEGKKKVALVDKSGALSNCVNNVLPGSEEWNKIEGSMKTNKDALNPILELFDAKFVALSKQVKNMGMMVVKYKKNLQETKNK